MKRIALTLIGVLAFALAGCDETSDTLSDGRTGAERPGPNDTAGGEDTTFDHSNDPGGAAPGADYQPADPAQQRLVGSPEVTSRLHSCGKLSVDSLADMIKSRSMASGGVPNNSPSAQKILDDSKPALGAANYDGRVPEAPFASTSAMAKMFDIYTMASYSIVQDNWSAPACPDTKVLEGGKFTKDGISCLIGRPATDAHLAIANDAVSKDPTNGAKIAIAAMLAAAHTCQ